MPAEVGAIAPYFSLKDQDGNNLTLDDLTNRKTLLVFIPFPFTGICEGELCELHENLDNLSDLDTSVVVITCRHPLFEQEVGGGSGIRFPHPLRFLATRPDLPKIRLLQR